ncbi:MAG: hypothetical protein CMJ78_10700 [Planctomycetaceae bacterium]|nr:hypothetical protein [Planctomycetaceae bacterium]
MHDSPEATALRNTLKDNQRFRLMMWLPQHVWQRIWQHLIQDSAIGSVFSFVVHIYLVWFLCFLVVPSNEGAGDDGPISVAAVISQTPSEPDQPAIDTRVDPSVLNDEVDEMPEVEMEQIEQTEVEQTETVKNESENEVQGSENGTEPVENADSQSESQQASKVTEAPPASKLKQKQTVEAVEETHQFAATANAVSKGSFTVWAVLDNPRKGEAYFIVVQVKVPDRVRRYRQSDLVGTVTGTDGYRKAICEKPKGYLPIIKGTVQYVVHIAPSQRSVRDIVNVRSKILKEKQILEIYFTDIIEARSTNNQSKGATR